MTTDEKTKLIRWLLLDAEDINATFKMKSYDFHAGKNEIGVIFKWENENTSQQKEYYESSGEINSHVNIVAQKE